MDPEVLTTKGQLPRAHDEDCRASSAAHVDTEFSVDQQLQSQAASETQVALFLPSWKRKPFLIFCFQNLVAKNVHLVAMMCLVFGF